MSEDAVADLFVNRVSGEGATLPAGYVPPLVSNGSLSLLVDHTGGQRQRAYCRMTPTIWWAGRRYGVPRDQLVPFGHWTLPVELDGGPAQPLRWTQTLDTREATVRCVNTYAGGLSIETLVFVPLDRDVLVVRQRVLEAGDTAVALGFAYQFGPPGDEVRPPRRTTCGSAWDAAAQTATLRYTLDGYPASEGLLTLCCDQPVTAQVDGPLLRLSAGPEVSEATFCLVFADTIDGPDHLARGAQEAADCRRVGCAGLLAEHRAAWAAYWSASEVDLPSAHLQRVYHTAQYHLRANTTRWSFPVGIFETHWSGRYFGWDEMFCYQALVSSNHPELARRCPEFRCAGLPRAIQRASHYNQPGRYGARFPWEAVEDGTDAVGPGFWMDHVFHLSNIALSAWFQYLYTHDRHYLAETGYAVLRECARYFLANVVYEVPEGHFFIGKVTDLERLGPARLNPYMTSCGAIYTLEAAAQAATLLATDDDEAADWMRAAEGLRRTLPNDGRKAVPYTGCQERSVASLGGLFPYPLFDADDALQRAAVLDFVAEGRASGNMYPVGNSVCAWYAGWMAAALAALGEREEPCKLLDEAAAGAGCFGELFEINEAEVAMHPWFSTASGNVVYALNQMLLQSRGDELRVAPAVPAAWRDYGFRLAAHGDLVVAATVRDGRLAELVLNPGEAHPVQRRTVVIPRALLDPDAVRREAVTWVTADDERVRCEVELNGWTVLVGSSPA